MEERFQLIYSRISDIPNEEILPSKLQGYFAGEADFILKVINIYEQAKNNELCKLDFDTLQKLNREVYEHEVDITHENAQNDAEIYLSILHAELMAMIPYAYECSLHNLLIRAELFLQIYSSFTCLYTDEERLPNGNELKENFFYYVSDYSSDAVFEKIKSFLDVKESFFAKMLKEHDFDDPKDLFLLGEYVTDTEIETLNHINSLPKETVKKMADTFSEGYRIGFVNAGIDLSKKEIVEIRYPLGFEPVIKEAMKNFEAMGLLATFRRASFNLLSGRGIVKNGCQGATFSRQFDFEHKEDSALFYDARINQIKLESYRKSFEKYKKEASVYAGPAVMESFGESAPEYVSVKNAPKFDKTQQQLSVEFTSKAMAIQNEYINEEERSFTIIAFPTPLIGPDFEAIFDETVKLNTLDYMLYRNVQQKMIDVFDTADYVIVKGKGNNKTNLKIQLCKLNNPEKETKFENCVADVNIPVGEVFTSPALKGTEGTLYVKEVYLNGLLMKDFTLKIKDGMIEDYSCTNFDSEEDNRRYIKENVLFNHDTLPMGEFAVGTNTTAYVMAKKYGIEDRMPILIAEKTGPHFAFGDTCYSHCEEVKVYNPDGKEIVSKENDYSLMRFTDTLKAYFNCHTDVTIPYDELSELSVVTYSDETITVIEDGRFSLSGCEVLNEAFESPNI